MVREYSRLSPEFGKQENCDTSYLFAHRNQFQLRIGPQPAYLLVYASTIIRREKQSCTSVYPVKTQSVAAVNVIRYDAHHVLTSVHHGHGVLLLPVSSCVDAWRNEELIGFYHFSTSKTHRRNRAGGFSICALRSSRSKSVKTTKGQKIENSHRFDRRTTGPANTHIAGTSHSTRRILSEHHARASSRGPREWPIRTGSRAVRKD